MSGQSRHDVLRGEAVRVPRLELECGHLVRYPKGPFGADDRIAPTRRRCYVCGGSQ